MSISTRKVQRCSLRRADGKMLKGPGYLPPALDDIAG
jgi:hypothetical protein